MIYHGHEALTNGGQETWGGEWGKGGMEGCKRRAITKSVGLQAPIKYSYGYNLQYMGKLPVVTRALIYKNKLLPCFR